MAKAVLKGSGMHNLLLVNDLGWETLGPKQDVFLLFSEHHCKTIYNQK